jgi:ribA/ribD-fused uncharacterized protein
LPQRGVNLSSEETKMIKAILPTSVTELCLRFNAGENFTFLHFWGHQASRNGTITQSCFSQWYQAAFEIEGISYATAEHFMMAEKAKLFGDQNTYQKILYAKDPGAAKALGREVAGFDETIWTKHRFDIVVKANYAKFTQHEALKQFLITTGQKILVEASPMDRIWGIGLSANDNNANNPNAWQGLNLLGFALMVVRENLSTNQSGAA